MKIKFKAKWLAPIAIFLAAVTFPIWYIIAWVRYEVLKRDPEILKRLEHLDPHTM